MFGGSAAFGSMTVMPVRDNTLLWQGESRVLGPAAHPAGDGLLQNRR